MIIGVDEVGRGSWAGPLVVGAVIINDDLVPGMTDSKLLNTALRSELALKIKESATAYSLGWVEAGEIDELGLTSATGLAIKRALAGIKVQYSEIIIDGKVNFLDKDPRVKMMVKADLLVPAVSAASIIAKVARDEYMVKLAQEYPKFGFERHVGYGTKTHREALALHGPCAVHRRSFKPVAIYG